MSFVFAFSLARFVSLVLAAVIPVRATMNSGETIDGELVEIKDSSLVIQASSGASELAFDDVLSLAPAEVEERTGPTKRVTLADGTKIAVQDCALTDETLVAEPRRQPALRIPSKQLKAIRFRAASPVTDPQWLGLMDKPLRQDLLVIRREGGRLDPTEVIVESIRDETVKFNLDGETVDAPAERLEGVVFGGAPLERVASSIQVGDKFGSQWLATSIAVPIGSNTLELELLDSLSHTIPLSHLKSIRWSGGLTLLAQQDPADTSYTPDIETNVGSSLMKNWFGPAPIGEANLLMVGDSWAEYRLDEDFQTFAGVVHRDENVRQAGVAIVKILLDGKAVWNEELSNDDTLGFELPVKGAKRVRIEVDGGDDGEVGDRIIVSRPRMLK